MVGLSWQAIIIINITWAWCLQPKPLLLWTLSRGSRPCSGLQDTRQHLKPWWKNIYYSILLYCGYTMMHNELDTKNTCLVALIYLNGNLWESDLASRSRLSIPRSVSPGFLPTIQFAPCMCKKNNQSKIARPFFIIDFLSLQNGIFFLLSLLSFYAKHLA